MLQQSSSLAQRDFGRFCRDCATSNANRSVKFARTSVVPKLLPFVTTVILYFAFVQHTERSSISSTTLKCMPILSLLLFVVITSSENFIVTQYRRRITYGLVFSSMGDLLLNFDLFEAGMGAFGIAQVYYILAFGLKPLKLWIGATLYALGFMAISLFYGNLNTIIKLCLPFYAILLLTMCWRSLARIEGSHNLLRIACGISSVLFVVSDGIIAFDKFFSTIPAAQIYIMGTYYIAQLGITLSINDLQLRESTTTKKTY